MLVESDLQCIYIICFTTLSGGIFHSLTILWVMMYLLNSLLDFLVTIDIDATWLCFCSAENILSASRTWKYFITLQTCLGETPAVFPQVCGMTQPLQYWAWCCKTLRPKAFGATICTLRSFLRVLWWVQDWFRSLREGFWSVGTLCDWWDGRWLEIMPSCGTFHVWALRSGEGRCLCKILTRKDYQEVIACG